MEEKKTWLEQAAKCLMIVSVVGMILVFFSDLETGIYKSLFLLFSSFNCLCSAYIYRKAIKRWMFWLDVGLGCLGILIVSTYLILRGLAG